MDLRRKGLELRRQGLTVGMGAEYALATAPRYV
jgi:hypothetical protein